MKSIVKIICIITLFFAFLTGGVYLLNKSHFENEYGMRKVVINRIILDVESGIAGTYDAELDDNLDEDSFEEDVSIDIEPFLDRTAYAQEFDKSSVPDVVEYIGLKNVTEVEESGTEYIRPIYYIDGTLLGFIRFGYESDDRFFTLEMALGVIVISYFVILIILFVVYFRIMKPFNNLSEYPERLAKGRMGEGIPETKSRLFGKYIWGMNMLKDEISLKDKNLSALEKEKQTLIVSIAHGIKTPLSNIKLYAEAIERGIYHEDKKPNDKDAETAAKICQNVEKVEVLVKEIMDSSMKADVEYKPVVMSFYLNEIQDLVKKEFLERMDILHIPFEMKCENNPLITSDKDGIFKIISQLLENAIKYGSGQGITLTMGRQDEDVIISVKNKGNVLSEEETAYVFKSFWRGSNATDIEGQGIGLYVSKRIAESLGGDIFMKSWETESTTEITLIIPIT